MTKAQWDRNGFGQKLETYKIDKEVWHLTVDRFTILIKIGQGRLVIPILTKGEKQSMTKN